MPLVRLCSRRCGFCSPPAPTVRNLTRGGAAPIVASCHPSPCQTAILSWTARFVFPPIGVCWLRPACPSWPAVASRARPARVGPPGSCAGARPSMPGIAPVATARRCRGSQTGGGGVPMAAGSASATERSPDSGARDRRDPGHDAARRRGAGGGLSLWAPSVNGRPLPPVGCAAPVRVFSGPRRSRTRLCRPPRSCPWPPVRRAAG